MGDVISMQYGGSIAHHASMGKKKGLGLGEIVTSIKRHYNNLITDPSKQRVLNLFLGIYNPLNNPVPLWLILDDAELHISMNKIVKLPQIMGTKWWVQHIKDFENSMPEELQQELTDILTRNPDSDSDDEQLNSYIEKTLELFNNELKYTKSAKDGLYYQEGKENEHHPILTNLIRKRQRKSLEAQDDFLMNIK